MQDEKPSGASVVLYEHWQKGWGIVVDFVDLDYVSPPLPAAPPRPPELRLWRWVREPDDTVHPQPRAGFRVSCGQIESFAEAVLAARDRARRWMRATNASR